MDKLRTYNLNFWLPTLVVGLFLLLFLLLSFLQYQKRVTEIHQDASLDLYENGLQLAHSIEYALSNNALEQAKSSISRYALRESAQFAALITADNRIQFATAFSWEEQPANSVFDTRLLSLLREADQSQQIHQLSQQHLLSIVIPLNNQPQQPDTAFTGRKLLLQDNIQPQLQQARLVFVRELLPMILLLSLVTLMLVWVNRRLVIGPLRALFRLAEQLPQAQHELHNPFRGDTELAAIAASMVNASQQIRNQIDNLAEREKHLAITLSSIGDAVIVTDANGRISRINPTACELTGWKEHDALNRPLPEVFFIENLKDDKPAINPVEQVLKTGRIVGLSNHTVLVSRDGQRRHISDSAAPIRNSEDSPIDGVILVFQDVTTQYKLRSELQQNINFLQNMLRILPSVTYVLDLSDDPDIGFGLSFVSESAKLYTGIDAETWLQNPEHWISHIHPDDVDQVKQMLLKACESRVPLTNEFRLRHQDGHYILVQDHLTAVRNEQGKVTQIVGVATDITERQQFLAQQHLLGDILERSMNEIYVFDASDLHFTLVNEGARENLGYSMEELQAMTPVDLKKSFTPESFNQFIQPLRDRQQKVLQFESEHTRKDGSRYPVSVNLQLDEHTEPAVFVSIIRDIASQRKSEQELVLANRVFEHSGEGVMVTDANNLIIRVNPAFCEFTGYSRAEVIGKDPALLSAGTQDKIFYQQMWQAITDHGHWSGEVWNRRKNGETYLQWLSISTITDDEGKVQNYIAVMSDITKFREAEKQISFLAHHDVLTQLPNRALLQDRMQQAMISADRHNQKLALLYLDLDRFKFINDSLGHAIGDELLIGVAERLIGQIRQEDTVCRTGGDEFIVLLPDTDADGAAHVAEKLVESLARPFNIQGSELFISLSIGVSIYPDNGHDAETLNKHADTAMYRAKHAGRNQYQFFTEEMHLQMVHKLELEHALRFALERGELEIFYQPQIDLHNLKITGCEALLRWHHPQYGDVKPLEFIPISEETGLINPIGDWVLHTAINQCQQWRDMGFPDLIIAINLSAIQFNNRQLVQRIDSILHEHQLPAANLELEITESVAMLDIELTISQLNSLAAAGIKLSLDDFGTGYSSLNYLKKFPIDKLKIDQSFVYDMLVDEDDAAIVDAVITLANTLSLKTLAEGVETDRHLQVLQQKGCDYAQGYFFSRPLSVAAFTELLEQSHHG